MIDNGTIKTLYNGFSIPGNFLAHEQLLIKSDGLLFILQKFFSYYNNQVVNKKMLEDV